MDGIVYVVDGDQPSRLSLRTLLEELGFSARDFASAEDFLSSFDRSKPGCVLTELRLKGMSGLDLVQTLSNRNEPVIPVLLVTAHANTALTVRALRAGAANVLDKPVEETLLWEAVHEAMRECQKQQKERIGLLELEAKFHKLTAKESEVLEMLLDGKTNRELASTLGVSIRTVESRRQGIFRKTKTGSLPELVKMAIDLEQRARVRHGYDDFRNGRPKWRLGKNGTSQEAELDHEKNSQKWANPTNISRAR